MKKICLITLCAILNVFAAEKEDGVLVLTDANFEEELEKHEYFLVEFYAPWCGHCKKLAPEYSAAAQILAKEDPPIALAKVDVTEQKGLGEKFEIKGFPTLKWFRKGEALEYTGGRSKDTIVSWVLKKTGPPSSLVTCEILEKKINDHKFVLAYFGEETDSLYTDAHVEFAIKEDKITFVHSNKAECAKKYGVTGPKIVLFRTFEEK
jgi:protein disulfide-isomerase A1